MKAKPHEVGGLTKLPPTFMINLDSDGVGSRTELACRETRTVAQNLLKLNLLRCGLPNQACSVNKSDE
jgi:hypothetical protein